MKADSCSPAFLLMFQEGEIVLSFGTFRKWQKAHFYASLPDWRRQIAGHVHWGNDDVTDILLINEGFGLMFSRLCAFSLTSRSQKNIAFGLSHEKKHDKADIRRRVKLVLESIHMQDFTDRSVTETLRRRTATRLH